MLDTSQPLVIVSGDSHVGPLMEQLRSYCPGPLLERYDDEMPRFRAMLSLPSPFDRPEDDERRVRTRRTAGHHDMDARLREMDQDGVAAEIMFHGSQNGEPFPFQGMPDFNFQPSSGDLKTAAVGAHMYNQWLADACAVAPGRLLGCMSLPIWDQELAIAEMRWARQAGLRMVNFPAGKAGIVGYEDPSWEPFWSACEELDVVLCTHSGSGEGLSIAPGAHAFPIGVIEAGGWPCRRNMTRMIFAGVFERHPALRLILTEQNGEWWTHQVMEYDGMWHTSRSTVGSLVPRPPHEYMRQSVFIGASFMAHFEAEAAVKEGYWENVIWGRDYPHIEGTWTYRDDPSAETATHEHLRWAFGDLPAAASQAMLGGNAIAALSLDRSALAEVAARIAAPSLDELAKPLDSIPADGGCLAFRQYGPWG